MPEAPEVQELASFLDAHLTGHRLRSVDVLLPKALKTQHPAVADVIGMRVTGVSRLGKMIDIQAADDGGDGGVHLIVHFGHDGWVLWHELAPDGLRRTGEATLMARVRLEGGSGFDLTDAGQWKSLTVHVVADPAEVPAVAKLGLDPMGAYFDPVQFAGVLKGRKKQIKALLQDQASFAGIGNAYSDEILHSARISPLTHAALLSESEMARLAASTRAVLVSATEARRGVSPAELRAAKHAALRVHRRAGEPCPVCGDEIRTFAFSGAAAQYCPTCQTGGALLA